MVSINLLRCKKLKRKEVNVLKIPVEPLLIPLQAIFFELASETLDTKLETDMIKINQTSYIKIKILIKTPQKDRM